MKVQPNDSEWRAEGKRWVILLLYNWIGFNQGLVWITFSASAEETKVRGSA